MKKIILVVFLFAVFFLPSAFICAQNQPEVISKEQLAAMTPAEALARLVEGNTRFTTGNMKERDWTAKVVLTAEGQNPFACILSCMDSRTSSEIIFDQGLGDIFNNRIAGNVVSTDVLAGMEYACKVMGAKLIVVIGHSECGAVKGAIDRVELGNLTELLNKIEAVADAAVFTGERSSKDKGFVELVTEDNVKNAIEEIRRKSPILKEMEDKGEIDIVGGMYDISTGKVAFY